MVERVLVVGSGAREHALVWALRRSPRVEEVYVTPGNPGMKRWANVLGVRADDVHSLAEAASDLKIDLTVIGPELPLALGVVDEFKSHGLRIFGPTRAAAEIESSKVFSKQLCQRHNIATADFRVVRDRDEAEAAVAELGLPLVIKADGLAAGKGVMMARDAEELAAALHAFFDESRFGAAGRQVVIERCLEGTELSYKVIADGRRAIPLATTRDYKRLLEGDEGPNTGGMGSVCPAILRPGLNTEIFEEIALPTIQAMAEEGRPFVGVLYIGVMLTADGPMVLEFNCRFGDPETQALVLRLDDDLAMVLDSAARGELAAKQLRWRKEFTACVVMCSEGYPSSPQTGREISGLAEAGRVPGVTVFHAGTKIEDGRLLTNGGRVLSVCGRGADLDEALAACYQATDLIDFEGKIIRRDIGHDVVAAIEVRRTGQWIAPSSS